MGCSSLSGRTVEEAKDSHLYSEPTDSSGHAEIGPLGTHVFPRGPLVPQVAPGSVVQGRKRDTSGVLSSLQEPINSLDMTDTSSALLPLKEQEDY